MEDSVLKKVIFAGTPKEIVVEHRLPNTRDREAGCPANAHVVELSTHMPSVDADENLAGKDRIVMYCLAVKDDVLEDMRETASTMDDPTYATLMLRGLLYHLNSLLETDNV